MDSMFLQKSDDEKKAELLFAEITACLIRKGLQISVMESCTAGLIASLLTDTEGASAAMKGAFVTYSNLAKQMQGVPAEVIDTYGVYSPETARAMAYACRAAYSADIGIGITGTFGNADPVNSDSRPGLVFYAIDFCGTLRERTLELQQMENRHAYKMAAAAAVGTELLSMLSEQA